MKVKGWKRIWVLEYKGVDGNFVFRELAVVTVFWDPSVVHATSIGKTKGKKRDLRSESRGPLKGRKEYYSWYVSFFTNNTQKDVMIYKTYSLPESTIGKVTSQPKSTGL